MSCGPLVEIIAQNCKEMSVILSNRLISSSLLITFPG